MNIILRIAGGVIVCAIAAILAFWLSFMAVILGGRGHSDIGIALVAALVAMILAGIAWQKFIRRGDNQNGEG